MASNNLGSGSNAEPSYLTSGNPGMNGGGTVLDGSTGAQIAAYENIFGPAARDIKYDSQRNKRHQRWHLPDALRGPNTFLTDRIDGLITDATNSPFTKNILPYKYVDQPDRKITWNVYSFDEGVASRVPYESAARVLPQSKQKFKGYAVRQGLAIAMEHNFMMSPEGMDNFRKQLQQLVGSIQMTNDLDVHMALLLAPSYQKQMDEKYYDNSMTTSQHCRQYTDLFGFMSKNDNGLDFLIEDAKNHLETWGSKPPTFILCNRGLTKGITMNPEKTMYLTAGPDGKDKLAAGPELPSYRGINFVNSRKFSLDTGTAPRDLLRRRVRVAEHYRIPWEAQNVTKRYEFYDQSRDSMFFLSWSQLWEAIMPSFEDPDKLAEFLSMSKTQNETVESYPVQGATSLKDIFELHAPQNQHADLQLDFQEFYKIGALLGFWPNTTKYDQGGRDFPLFLKKRFEYVTYSDTGDIIRQYSVLLPDATSMDPADLVIFGNLAVLFISHTINKNKHGLGRVIDAYLNDASGTAFAKKYVRDMTGASAACALAGNQATIFPCDLFLLRPNIEHYMLGIIFGRGGGPEELGATFWGQTELSVYDDTQHGIWGMSYKYHERAIVTNERNLIRVFDVAFDGYSGGNDSRIVKWESEDLSQFSSATKDTSKAYSGPSMLVFALPVHANAFDSFPNPVVFHPTVTVPDGANAIPDRSLRFVDLPQNRDAQRKMGQPGTQCATELSVNGTLPWHVTKPECQR